MSDPGRLRRVRELFDEALARPAAERAAWLAAAAAGDDALRREVEALLATDQRTSVPLDTPLGVAIEPDLVGRRLGPYELVRVLGVGGMGAVYEAVRADDQYRKRVAIKLVRGQLNSPRTLAHFRRERQILADLAHKNIAALLDGGVDPSGQPFLVMEYVEGEPITAWCDRRRLSVRARVELFRQVCDAVRHAHQNLVVHGDLKPGNILVTTDGSVKLLDFGIARLLGEDDDPALPATRGSLRAYTPEYASPEQIRGELLTTATDVWSLGVVLYELLAGPRPHADAEGTPAAIERAVLEQPIARPSSGADADAAAARGERGAAALRRRLAGDLDAIVMHALREDAAQRCPSAESLGDDLRRQLAGLPVQAHRGWAGYRARKFLSRNRGFVAAGALVLLALVAGVVSTSLEARHARAAQARAERVSDFLAQLLYSVRSETQGRDVPVSELLDAAGRRLGTDLADEPGVRAELEGVVGLSDNALGRYDEAIRHMRASAEGYARTDGPRSRTYVLALNNLANAEMNQGDFDAADSIQQVALATQRAASREPDTLMATLLANAGSIAHNRGRIPDAERYHRQALAIRQKLLPPHADIIAGTMNNLAVALGEQGRWAAAESIQRQAVAILRVNHPEPSVQLASAENSLATALDLQGKYAEADSLYRDVLYLRGKVLGTNHPDYAFTLVNYSMFLFDRGRYGDAADMSHRILALRDRGIPEGHPSIAAALQNLGRCEDQSGDHDAARRSLQESLALRRKYLGPDHWLVASSYGVLAEHDLLVHDLAAADHDARTADAIFEKALGPDHPRTVANLRRMARIDSTAGRADAAARILARLPAGS